MIDLKYGEHITNHVGIVCDDDKAAELGSLITLIYGDVPVRQQYIDEFQCDCIMLGSNFELLVPKGGPLLEWLAENGTAIHHVALKVDNVKELSEAMREGGLRMLCEEPVKGIIGSVNFIHPEEFGIMIELVQEEE